MRKKILVLTGSRADYGLLRPILFEITKSKKLELHLVVTGSHLSKMHGLTVNEIKKDGFTNYHTFNFLPKKDQNYYAALCIGNGITKFTQILYKIKPHINVILGDRDEMLVSAIAASHMNIVNVHIHGGDKSGGIDEYNRHAITKLSNIHFAATKKSKERIIKMGENPKFVFFSGSPAIDEVIASKIAKKEQLEKKYNISLTGKEIILLQHPVTNEVSESGKQIRATLDAIIRLKRPTIVIAPNSDSGHKRMFRIVNLYVKKFSFIKFYPNVPRSDYLALLKYGGLLIGNSSSGIIEASCFDIPVINIGTRQQNREHGNNVHHVPEFSTNKIYRTILYALRKKKTNRGKSQIYGKGTASVQIVKILENLKINNELTNKQIQY